MAPFTPFLAEELYQKLTGGESVHLLDWPMPGHVNELVLKEMAAIRQAINDGLSKRAAEKIKVRQPLGKATLVSVLSSVTPQKLNDELVEIVKDELNVKMVEVLSGSEIGGSPNPSVELDFTMTPELKREGLAREVIRHVQSARKTAGLSVDDRITLSLQTSDEELKKAIEEYGKVIAAETLADEIGSGEFSYKVDVKVEGSELVVSLEKIA